MVNIDNTIKLFLKKYNLNNIEKTYLVGFSGGYDSMCLLYSLKKIAPNNKIIALHLNHGWRGEESDSEEKVCKSFCEEIGVEFYCERLSDEISHTETAARDARYKFFETCCQKFQSDIVFTAHNANDNAETIIYRICKGTGIVGLKGICEYRKPFYRPLLTVCREEIENYIKLHHLKPNCDSSNSNIKYKRNYIRAKILPELMNINKDAIYMINSLSEVAKEETQIIDEYINSIEEKITIKDTIQTKKFMQLSRPIQKKIIYNIFLKNKLDYDRKKITKILEFIIENSNSKSGKTCSLTDNLWLFTNEKIIKTISDNTNSPQYLNITKEGKYKIKNYIFEIEKFEKKVIKFPKDSDNTAYVDLSNTDFNFELRTRQNGDIIQPFGMKGRQKLKKYLNSKKIPNHQKDKLLFLTQNEEVLWAINIGINDKIKVDKIPTHRLRFYENESE